MPRIASRQPNDVELAILRVVWDRKACSVRDVHEALQPERQTGYTSTLQMMQVTCETGLDVAPLSLAGVGRGDLSGIRLATRSAARRTGGLSDLLWGAFDHGHRADRHVLYAPEWSDAAAGPERRSRSRARKPFDGPAS